MKALQRLVVVGLGTVAALAPLQVAAQYGGYSRRGGGRTIDTPELMVGTCHASPRQLGVDAAKELRDRIQTENNERDLYVIPDTDLNNALRASGYAPDSALNISDLAALGKLVHANEVLDCDATKTATGVHVDARMFLVTDATQTQPLPSADGKDFGEAAKGIERANTAARKQLDGYSKCRNELSDGKLTDAMKDAQDAIRNYAQSTLARICLANAYADPKANFPPDSVLALTDEILKIDPENVYAIQLAIGAYDRKGDKEHENAAMLKLYQLEPQNQSLALKIVDQLASSPDTASANKALAIVNDMLKTNPGDPEVLQQKWKLQARLSMYAQAIVTGELMVRGDTSLADSAYFNRQMAMANADTNWAKQAQYAAQAEKKYPTNARYPYLGGVALRRTGQLQPAAASFQRALALNPTNDTTKLFLAQTYTELGEPDSVVKLADAAIAAGGDKTTWGPMLLAPAQEAFTKAQADSTTALENYRKAYRYAMHADSVSPSKYTKFFGSVSAFQIGVAIYRDITTNNKKDCGLAKQANDLFLTTQQFLPEGGSVDPGTATSILQYLPQLADATGKMVKLYCKSP